MELKIGKTIKELRTERGITMAELADALSVTPQSVSRWESGTSYPDIEMLPRIADYFSVSLDKLMLDSDEITIKRLVAELAKVRSSLDGDASRRQKKEMELLKQLSQLDPRQYITHYFACLKAFNNSYRIYDAELDRLRREIPKVLSSIENVRERTRKLSNVIFAEDEDKLYIWKSVLPSLADDMATWEEMMFWRYGKVLHDKDGWRKQQEENAYLQIRKLITTLADNIPEKHENCRSVDRCVLLPLPPLVNMLAAKQILDTFSRDVKDAFLWLRLCIEIQLAGAYCREGQYDAMHQSLVQLKEHVEIAYALREGGMTLYASHPVLASVKEENVSRYLLINALYYIDIEIERPEFDAVREDKSFTEFCKYIRAYIKELN
ncbi:MAG: helix-turn-helix domain-containing protein [Ruminococcaceae bacterium]|nr:helix-turn-helix domain-containing protein [Oscillospiraceae bacterium]